MEFEAQRTTDVSGDQPKGIYFHMNLFYRNVHRLICSRSCSQSARDGTTSPTEGPELSELYNLPGEIVAMKSEIECAMRHGDIEFLENMKSLNTPMACFKTDKGDSILHIDCSIIAIVSLIWAQLGDQKFADRAFNLALPSLFVALTFMSAAFYFGVDTTIKHNRMLRNSLFSLFLIFSFGTTLLLTPYVIPQLSGVPVIKEVTSLYLFVLLMSVNEADDENHSNGHTVCVGEGGVTGNGKVESALK